MLTHLNPTRFLLKYICPYLSLIGMGALQEVYNIKWDYEGLAGRGYFQVQLWCPIKYLRYLGKYV